MSGNDMEDAVRRGKDFFQPDASHQSENESLEQAEIRKRLQAELLVEISSMLVRLHPREAGIIRARFGLDGSEQKTRDQISEEFGITLERIKQIESKSMSKLRFQLNSKGLLHLLEGS
jgi:RNA polymerase sigma factor (sigma-70 family)